MYKGVWYKSVDFNELPSVAFSSNESHDHHVAPIKFKQYHSNDKSNDQSNQSNQSNQYSHLVSNQSRYQVKNAYNSSSSQVADQDMSTMPKMPIIPVQMPLKEQARIMRTYKEALKQWQQLHEQKSLPEKQSNENQSLLPSLSSKISLSSKSVQKSILAPRVSPIKPIEQKPLTFDDIQGNVEEWQMIKNWLNQRASQSYCILFDEKLCLLISGPSGIGKSTGVQLMLKQLGYRVQIQSVSNINQESQLLAAMMPCVATSLNLGLKRALPNAVVLDEIDSDLDCYGSLMNSSVGQELKGRKLPELILNRIDIFRNSVKQPGMARAPFYPLICICNSLDLESVRTLAQHCLHVKMKPLDADALKKIITRQTNINLSFWNDQDMEMLLANCQGDARTMIKSFDFFTTGNRDSKSQTARSFIDQVSAKETTSNRLFWVSKILLQGDHKFEDINRSLDRQHEQIEILPWMLAHNTLHVMTHLHQKSNNPSVNLSNLLESLDSCATLSALASDAVVLNRFEMDVYHQSIADELVQDIMILNVTSHVTPKVESHLNHLRSSNQFKYSNYKTKRPSTFQERLKADFKFNHQSKSSDVCKSIHWAVPIQFPPFVYKKNSFESISSCLKIRQQQLISLNSERDILDVMVIPLTLLCESVHSKVQDNDDCNHLSISATIPNAQSDTKTISSSQKISLANFGLISASHIQSVAKKRQSVSQNSNSNKTVQNTVDVVPLFWIELWQTWSRLIACDV